MNITPAHIRAARAVLKWSAPELADHAGIGSATVQRFESGADVLKSNLDAMTAALEQAGIILVDASNSQAVEWRKSTI